MSDRFIKPVRFGKWTIGPGHPCFIIAEIGPNHNGDITLAKRLIDVAVKAGADAVKFQTGDPRRVMADATPKAGYQRSHTGEKGTMLDMHKGIVLDFDEFAVLKTYCDQQNILFLSTPFDLESVDFLVSLGMPAIKVPSGELTNPFLLRRMGATGRPILMSTGMSTVSEIGTAMEILRAAGSGDVALFQCVSNYPAEPEGMNLRAIPALSAVFGVPCGFSDHSLGIDLMVAAVGLGANLVEKHFTLDRTMIGPDHAMSLEPAELSEMVRAIRRVERALGDGVKRPQPQEMDVRNVARRSLAAARDIAEGQVVTMDDFFALRPATGLAPAMAEMLVGRKAVRAITARTLIKPDDFS